MVNGRRFQQQMEELLATEANRALYPQFLLPSPRLDFHRLSNSLLYGLLESVPGTQPPWCETQPMAHSRQAYNLPHSQRDEILQSALWSHLLMASKGVLIKLSTTIILVVYKMLSNMPGTLSAILPTIMTTLQANYHDSSTAEETEVQRG